MEKIKDVVHYLESLAPKSSQENYDNSGLLVGNKEAEVEGVLVCLDSIEAVVEEAIQKGCNLIVAHHPIIFKGLTSITGKNYVERVVLQCIKNDIALYAIHTNLDNYRFGVNFEIAKRLDIHSPEILAPKQDVLQKLIVYVPKKNAEQVKNALFDAGAGEIGEYSECAFELEGNGSFKPSNSANPTIGKSGKRENVNETRLEVLVSTHQMKIVLQAMQEAHPYEEVAHDILHLANANHFEGAGMIGELAEEMDAKSFLRQLKNTFNCGVIRHTELIHKKVKTIAWCGGSGSFLLPSAKAKQADIYITGDFKYHEFFDADNSIIIADIGHFESEQFTIQLLGDKLTKKFPTFAVHLTEINTNPIKYF